MQIESIQSGSVNLRSVTARPNSRPASAEASPSAALDLGHSEALTRALMEADEVRPEMVARGRELNQDVLYPPTTIINQISRLIANRWETPA